MCQELNIRTRSGFTFSLLIPFPVDWNYVVDAAAVHEEVPRESVALIYGGRLHRFEENSTAEDRYIQFQTPWETVELIIENHQKIRLVVEVEEEENPDSRENRIKTEEKPEVA